MIMEQSSQLRKIVLKNPAKAEYHNKKEENVPELLS